MTLIKKSDGTTEPFDPLKLHSSLERARAREKDIDYIVQHIEEELAEGMTTAKIYRHAYSLLRKRERPTASRYSMRRAILEFGPTGFPFERFIAEIFRAQGFTANTDVMVQGNCAFHEVDLVGQKGDRCLCVEAKFHNRPGIKSDMKVALYVKARFDDIVGRQVGEVNCKINEGWLITNTKFTRNAIEYGRCVGLHMLSWNYPEKKNLQNLIEETGVYPITALTTLTRNEKRQLLEHNIALCTVVIDNGQALRDAGIEAKKIEMIIEESRELCESPKALQ